jgi:hypothetical protein
MWGVPPWFALVRYSNDLLHYAAKDYLLVGLHSDFLAQSEDGPVMFRGPFAKFLPVAQHLLLSFSFSTVPTFAQNRFFISTTELRPLPTRL